MATNKDGIYTRDEQCAPMVGIVLSANPSVSYELEVLEENLDMLNKAVSNLEERLEFILGPAACDTALGNAPIQTAQSRLSNDLVRLVSKVKIITMNIGEIIQRVDL
jgi:hypothetical protein